MKKIKNIYPTIDHGKQVWCVDISINKIRKRKFFNSRNNAVDYLNLLKNAQKLDLSFFANLPPQTIKDIVDALNILPQGKTLTESVTKAWEFNSTLSLHKAIDDFLIIKKSKLDNAKLSKDEHIHIKGRMQNFKDNFSDFNQCTPLKIKNYLSSKGKNGTIIHYKVTINDFFNSCVRHDIIRTNPISKIHIDEILKPQEDKEIEFIDINTTAVFMQYVEKELPRYAKFYALALFCGIRVAEIPRLKEEYFRYEDKKIIFPAKIGKITKAWTLENLPDNLWTWLNKYKDKDIIRPHNKLRASLAKQFNLPHNFARHSFATYHLSLYFDTALTSKITRNSEQMLKNHYWGALVDKSTAENFFKILPSQQPILSTLQSQESDSLS